MTEYQMPVKAIKSILKKEIEEFSNVFHRAYPSFIMADVMKEMVYISKNYPLDKIEKCATYDDLEEIISEAGYRMSLEEWIDSL